MFSEKGPHHFQSTYSQLKIDKSNIILKYTRIGVYDPHGRSKPQYTREVGEKTFGSLFIVIASLG